MGGRERALELPSLLEVRTSESLAHRAALQDIGYQKVAQSARHLQCDEARDKEEHCLCQTQVVALLAMDDLTMVLASQAAGPRAHGPNSDNSKP